MIVVSLLLICMGASVAAIISYKQTIQNIKRISSAAVEENRRLTYRYEALRTIYQELVNKSHTVHLVCEQYNEEGNKDDAELIPIGVFSSSENAVEYIDMLKLTKRKEVVGYAINEFEVDKMDDDGDI